MGFIVAHAGAQAALAVGLAIFMNVALGGVLAAWQVSIPVFGHPWRFNGLTFVALATIWLVAAINCASVSTGGRTALAVTIAKVLLVLGVGVGAFLFAPGAWSNLTSRMRAAAAKALPRARAAASPDSVPRCSARSGPTTAGTMSLRSRRRFVIPSATCRAPSSAASWSSGHSIYSSIWRISTP
jgi:amino acid transporter